MWLKRKPVMTFVNTNMFWFHNCWKHFDKLSNYWLLKKDSASLSWMFLLEPTRFGTFVCPHATQEGKKGKVFPSRGLGGP
jgi:hypothetical protein